MKIHSLDEQNANFKRKSVDNQQRFNGLGKVYCFKKTDKGYAAYMAELNEQDPKNPGITESTLDCR